MDITLVSHQSLHSRLCQHNLRLPRFSCNTNSSFSTNSISISNNTNNINNNRSNSINLRDIHKHIHKDLDMDTGTRTRPDHIRRRQVLISLKLLAIRLQERDIR